MSPTHIALVLSTILFIGIIVRLEVGYRLGQ
jgi:hypothetical protein